MGICGSKEATKNELPIHSNKKEDSVIELLLLGSGDSGKSTFCKQLMCLYKDGLSAKETRKYVEILQHNVLTNMQMVGYFLEDQEEFELSPENKEIMDEILDEQVLNENVLEKIMHLWSSDQVIQNIVHDDLGGLDSHAVYYFENAERFIDEYFQPTQEDIMKARMKTTGISDISFTSDGTEFRITDVGGQRSERRKWISTFKGNIASVLFLVALDEFDKQLVEDPETNRFDESLKLFGEVTSSQWFADTAFVLFMNKDDLFRKKIKNKPKAMNNRFADVSLSDSKDYDASYRYIQRRFEDAYGGSSRLYVYPTCAISTDDVSNIFSTVRNELIINLLSVNNL
eukprot:TRINITY_DN6957_c0_g1_i1.p1 TRINITY_DN6957_c0_g1~~TRINITY_DN6957_c0_g1_i1.p1  ORF type:complete len:343 (+),score=79.86 TRINITY_DN6957_c0_g1_i1:63-1091(+)